MPAFATVGRLGDMLEEEFIKRILGLTREAGILFSEPQGRMCFQHISLMLEWNRQVNLTRITDYQEILIKHILDSLVPARWLPDRGMALDIGTGAGFPGVPLKVLHPELQMVLLEAHRKKISFLKVLLSRLSLDNIRAVQGRWEELHRMRHPFGAKRYSLVTMRAVRLQREHLVSFAAKILEPGGVFAWWAGPEAQVEREELTTSLECADIVYEGRVSYELPSLSRPRHLFLWKRKASLDTGQG